MSRVSCSTRTTRMHETRPNALRGTMRAGVGTSLGVPGAGAGGTDHRHSFAPGGAATGGSYVNVVEGLTASQGSLSIASALFAGFGFAGLSSVTQAEYNAVHPVFVWAYAAATVLSITSNLYVCGICTILEQEGRIAAALAHAKPDTAAYEAQLKEWYSAPPFAGFRTRVFWVFAFGVPGFALSIALFCLLKLPGAVGMVACVAVALFGAHLFRTYLWINAMFRAGVLGLGKKLTFSAPRTGSFSRGGNGNGNGDGGGGGGGGGGSTMTIVTAL